MAEFVIPDFLKGQSPEEIHQDMIEQMPDDIDMSWGNHAWNYTYPTAYIVSMLIQFRFIEMLKMITPQHCQGYDAMAEEHGETRAMERKAAIASTGEVEITAEAGTVIPEGSICSTPSINDVPSVDFKTMEDVTFDTETTQTINIEAVKAGSEGNVQPNTITLIDSDIQGVISVNNPKATTGGMEEESLDDFIQRMVELDRSKGETYIGNLSDYERWAEEVEGVGLATAEEPVTDDGIITIIISDQNGDPASPAICAKVFNHIMNPTPLSTDGTQPEGMTTGKARLAPPNAYICVTSPQKVYPTISASVQIDKDITTLEEVKTTFSNELKKYFLEATEYIYISKVGSLLQNISGVIDYDIKSLLINGEANNVKIAANTRPIIDVKNITLTTY